MRICIIGAGAMGSLYGALLARSGQEVILYDRWQEHVDAINRDGLRLEGITGEMVAEVTAVTDPAAIGTADLCIVQVNTHGTSSAAEVARDVLTEGGACLTLQNGVGNIEKLSEVLGRDRVIGGLSYHSAAMKGPGVSVHTHAGPTWLGELDVTRSERLDRLAETLKAAGFEPTIVDDIESFIWGKFIHNCSINPICALLGIRVGEIPMYPAADEFQSGILEEAIAVVRAKGITVPDADPFASIKSFCRVKFNKPSMLQHVESGKRTEIDSLNAVIVEEGAKLGIPTPHNAALATLIRAVDQRNAFHADGAPDFDKLEREAKARYSASASASG